MKLTKQQLKAKTAYEAKRDERYREEERETAIIAKQTGRLMRKLNRGVYVNARIAKLFGMSPKALYEYLKLHEKSKLKSITLEFQPKL